METSSKLLENTKFLLYSCKLQYSLLSCIWNIKLFQFYSNKRLHTKKMPQIIHDKVTISSDLLNMTSNTVTHPAKQVFHKSEIIYGIYPVLIALQAKKRTFRNLYYKANLQKPHNDNIREIQRLAALYDIPLHITNENKLRKITGNDSVHQGVCLEASALPTLIIDDINCKELAEVENDSKSKPKLWIFIDQVHDPMNMGAILRTAYYFGVEKVLANKFNSCPITSTVSKASSGASEILPVHFVMDAVHFIKNLKRTEWEVISTSASSNGRVATPLDNLKPTKNILLILGNEGKGISAEVEEAADITVTIPRYCDHAYNIESLNVSAAASVLIYSLSLKLNS